MDFKILLKLYLNMAFRPMDMLVLMITGTYVFSAYDYWCFP